MTYFEITYYTLPFRESAYLMCYIVYFNPCIVMSMTTPSFVHVSLTTTGTWETFARNSETNTSEFLEKKLKKCLVLHI